MSRHLLVVGVGGLGTAMVQEALQRDVAVSVLVRDRSKVVDRLGPDVVERLTDVFVGDGTDDRALDAAIAEGDAVLSGLGANPAMARALAHAVARKGAAKLCWPAGTTNVKAEDGVTPNYQTLLDLGPWVEGAYRTHGACIDEIRAAGIDYVIFCPGRMAAVGRRTPDVAGTVRINRDAGPFVSYEDAAWVMVEGGLTDRFDRQLVSAATNL